MSEGFAGNHAESLHLEPGVAISIFPRPSRLKPFYPKDLVYYSRSANSASLFRILRDAQDIANMEDQPDLPRNSLPIV